MTAFYIGLISGTSVDGIDAVLVDLETTPRLVETISCAFPEPVRDEIVALCKDGEFSMDALAGLDRRLGMLFGSATNKLLEKAGVDRDAVRAIGSHGQTVRHAPDRPITYTVQIGDPNTIAELTGITTVADFRRRDMAAGGQGAPLVPPFHAAVFRATDEDRVVLNIGGIGNITLLPADPAQPVTGFDTGPGNGLMDAWIRHRLGKPFDRNGEWAAGGNVDGALLDAMCDDTYFHREPPKSTGREYFNLNWVLRCLATHGELSAENVQATLCELTAATIARDIRNHAPSTRRVIACGGGAHNAQLMHRLAALLPQCIVESTTTHDIPPDWIEAMAFAWLAKQTLDGRPGNLPSVTGAKRAVVLGGIYQA